MTSPTAVRNQFRSVAYPETSFAGQTIIVTGANTGLGLEAARHFVRLEAARVILAVRSIPKGEEAKVSIEDSTKRHGVVDVWKLDMLDYESIKHFISRCSTLNRLDVVVANAGILRNNYEASEGIEVTIKVNVIGTFLLVIGLLPAVRKSTKVTGQLGRIVITSSVMHEEAKFRERRQPAIFKAFNEDKSSHMADRYNTSKLLEVLLVRSIAAAMQDGPHSNEALILNSVNPGLCYSSIDRDVKGLFGLLLSAAKAIMARTTEEGSRTLVHAAAVGLKGHGQYMSEGVVYQPSSFVRSDEGAKVQARVHQELMDILEKISPGISENI